MTSPVIIGDATLYCGDCRDYLQGLLGLVDSVVTDPPYGIGESAARNRTRGSAAQPGDYGDDAWDHDPCPDEVLWWMQNHTDWQIIFGGNYFCLPPASCWLVWDKLNGDNDFADCELAWTNLPKAVRRIRWMWNGMLRKGNEERFHLTQKPLEVMRWCIGHLPRDCGTIFDPFMGSGTTGVAAVMANKKFVGIEREPKYFDIACRRIEQAYAQPDMFVTPPAKPVQEAML